MSQLDKPIKVFLFKILICHQYKHFLPQTFSTKQCMINVHQQTCITHIQLKLCTCVKIRFDSITNIGYVGQVLEKGTIPSALFVYLITYFNNHYYAVVQYQISRAMHGKEVHYHIIISLHSVDMPTVSNRSSRSRKISDLAM